MILSRKALLQAIQDNKILTSDFRDELINNQSIDVRLGRWVYIQSDGIHPMKYWHDLDVAPLECHKNKFYLTHTEEFIGTAPNSDILPSFKLRSSAGRHGIIHTLAGHGDVGFMNRWAMEFIAAKPITLERYMKIGQIYFTLATESGSYSEETGNYQSTSDFELLQTNWDKLDLLPKPLNKVI